MRMKALMTGVALAGFAVMAASAASASTCNGNCGTLGADGDVSAPPPAAGSANYTWVSTSGGPSGVGQIGGVGGTNGSEFLSDTFSAAAGDELDFFFNYVTADGTGAFVDYSFAELLTPGMAHVAWLFTARTNPAGQTSPGFGLPANDSTLTPASVTVAPGATNWSPLGSSSGGCYGGPGNGCGNTGWVESTYTIAGAGDYVLRLGVTNYGDTAVDSGLAFAGAKVGGVGIPLPSDAPEPASWAMMLAGFGAIGAAMRQRRRSVAFA